MEVKSCLLKKVDSKNEISALQVTITSTYKENIAKMAQLFANINSMCSMGASRVIQLDIDGDGACDIRIKADKGSLPEPNFGDTIKENTLIFD